MSPNFPRIDQALDGYYSEIQPAAESYDGYLQGEYEDHYLEDGLHPQWNEHYRQMRRAFRQFLAQKVQAPDGMPLRDLNVGIVGPGMAPVGRDFDDVIIDDYLSQVNAVVVIDISTRVVHKALCDLFEAGVPVEKLYGVQFDMTSRWSTFYEQCIRKWFGNVETAEHFAECTQIMRDFSISDLDQQICFQEDSIKHKPTYYLEGGINENRTLALTIDGNPLPLHAVSLQMCAAGTGAAAEDLIKERYHEMVHRCGGSVEEERELPGISKAVFENMHSMIMQYNTQTTHDFIVRLFRGNPEASVLAITDINTWYKKPKFGQLLRLDQQKLKTDLKERGIEATITDGWQWHDSKHHFHDINTIEFNKDDRGLSKITFDKRRQNLFKCHPR